jgi:sRNA-binding regulator protein Hfq
MKETAETLPAERAQETEAFGNRRLIRPSLNRNDHHNHSNHSNHGPVAVGERRERTERGDRGERNDRGDRGGDRHAGGKKTSPPEQTNAENFYYQKQMQSKTAMVIVLRDGEEIHGVIEWYDKSCVKVNRTSAPNLVIYKPSIKYMYKEGENAGK